MTQEEGGPESFEQSLATARDTHRELIRHVRNALAVVRSLVGQPAAETDDIDDYRARLGGRVDAFARAQSTLLRDLARGTDLEDLVRGQLLVFGVRADEAVDLGGPTVRLDAQATGLMALLVHELTLGSLEGGRPPRAIRWDVDPHDLSLELAWIDDTPAAPALDWIERAIRYELKGTIEPNGDGSARHCFVRLPARHLIR